MYLQMPRYFKLKMTTSSTREEKSTYYKQLSEQYNFLIVAVTTGVAELGRGVKYAPTAQSISAHY